MNRENPAITNKLSNALMVHSAAHFERNFTQKAQKEQFGVSKDQKVLGNIFITDLQGRRQILQRLKSHVEGSLPVILVHPGCSVP